MPKLMIDGELIAEIDDASAEAIRDIATPKMRAMMDREGRSLTLFPVNSVERDEPIYRGLPPGLGITRG